MAQSPCFGGPGPNQFDDVSYVVNSESVTNSVMCAVTLEVTRRDTLRLDLRHITDVYRDGDDGDYGAAHALLSWSHRF